MNFKDLFNKYKRDYFFRLHKDRITSNFKSASLQLKAIKEDDDEICEFQLKGWRKNTMGYRGGGVSSGLFSGLRSKSTLSLSSKDCVYDHLVGASLCGETVETELTKSNYNHSNLIKHWLFDNLYLWGTIKVSKMEHRKDNILRNKNSLEEKIKLDHYKTLQLGDLVIEEQKN